MLGKIYMYEEKQKYCVGLHVLDNKLSMKTFRKRTKRHINQNTIKEIINENMLHIKGIFTNTSKF